MESKGGRKREYELGCCSSGANHLVSDKESLKRQTVGQARPADWGTPRSTRICLPRPGFIRVHYIQVCLLLCLSCA